MVKNMLLNSVEVYQTLPSVIGFRINVKVSEWSWFSKYK